MRILLKEGSEGDEYDETSGCNTDGVEYESDVESGGKGVESILDVVWEVESGEVGFEWGGHEFLVYGADEVEVVYSSNQLFHSISTAGRVNLHIAV